MRNSANYQNSFFKLQLLLCISLLLACQEQQMEERSNSYPSDPISTSLDYRPNIVCLVAEDLSPYIPAFGDSTVVTPNLDRLAQEGIRYTNVYSPSGVCSPSRYALITGRYPSGDGAHHMRTTFGDYLPSIGLQNYDVVPPLGVRMYSEIMREQGYYCTNSAKTDYQFGPTVMGWDENSNSAHWRNREEGQAFFSVFNFDITHESQFFEPQSTYKMRFYDDFPNPKGVYGWSTPTDSMYWLLPDSVTEFPIPPYLPTTDTVIHDFKTMYNNLLVMDEQVGIILDQLEEDGLMDNTILVWYTDHGGPLPRQKRALKDSGINVPMIIRYPDTRGAGQIDSQLISFIDFAPTLLSMANIPAPDYIQGQAFAGHFQAEEKRTYVHAAADRFDGKYDMRRAVRNNRYKYIRNFKPEMPYCLDLSYRNNIATMQELYRLKRENKLNDIQLQWLSETKSPEELYDTWNDPHEIHNLANSKSHAETLNTLSKELDAWMAKIEDKGFIPEADIIQSFRPNGKQLKVAAPTIVQSDDTFEIRCSTAGATIAYQLLDKEAELKGNWTIYKEPIKVNSDQRVVAIADRAGWAASEIAEY